MIKVGTPLHYINEVREDGELIDITSWGIAATAHANAVDGPVLGNYTVTHLSLGVYELILATNGFAPCQVYTDVRLQPPDMDETVTPTNIVTLLPAGTPP